jgi:hypothetical protein
MTVCIAAIGRSLEGSPPFCVMGASDRMLTAGDIQYQPAQPKILTLSSAIAVMTSGDASIQAQILYRTGADVQARIVREPDNWWSVEDVARLYLKYAMQYRAEEAELAYLAPHGLTYETWISRQHELAPRVAANIAEQLTYFPAPGVSAIIMGVDLVGPHIYVVHRDEDGRRMTVSREDYVGFAAIGSGSNHAESQMMLGGHATTNGFADTLRLLYKAKKSAEVAPGVGEATDLLILGPRLGENIIVRPDVLGQLEGLHDREQQAIRKSDERGRKAMEKWISTLTAAPQQQAPDSGGGPGPGAPTEETK